MSDPEGKGHDDPKKRTFARTIRLDVRDGGETTKPHPRSVEPPGAPTSIEPATSGEVAEPLDLLQAVLATLPTGLLLLDTSGTIVGLNRAAAAIFEGDTSDLVGRRLVDLRAELESMLWTADKQEVLLVAQGRPGEIELSETKVLGFTSRTVPGPVGVPRGTVVSFSDITEAKLREKDEAHRRRLEDLGRITATLAHEIRNPVFAIMSLAQVLQGEPAVAGWADGQEMLARIVDETKRISALIDDLLFFGRRKQIRRTRGDLWAVVSTVVDGIRRGVEDRMVDVRIEAVRGDGKDGPLYWHFDENAIRRVLVNLIRNAVSAIERKAVGGGRVRVTASADSRWVTLRIEDDGVGIPAEHLDRIFDEFYTTTNSGTGLGLPVCRSVVRQHGGEIRVDSVEGVGTTVTVELPAQPDGNPP